MKDPITVIADDRERPGKVIDLLAAMPDVTLSIRRLAVGDYQLNECLLVERKTMIDFATSIVDGRLFKQMTRLAGSPQSRRQRFAVSVENRFMKEGPGTGPWPLAGCVRRKLPAA